MALGIVQLISKQAGSVASITTTAVTTSAGNLLVVIPFCDTNKIGATPITDSKSNTWTQAVASFGSATYMAMYYAENCLGGATHTFTFTPTSSEFVAIGVLEISGAATSSAIGSTSTSTTNTASHSSGSISAGVTVPEILIGGLNPGSAPNVSAPYWSWNQQVVTVSLEGAVFGYHIVNPSVSEAFTVTTASSLASPIMIAGFKSATALGGGTQHSHAYFG